MKRLSTTGKLPCGSRGSPSQRAKVNAIVTVGLIATSAACKPGPAESPAAIPPETVARPDASVKPQAPKPPARKEFEVSSLAEPKLSSRIENDGASVLTYQPGTHRLIASGRTIHELSPRQAPVQAAPRSYRNLLVGADGTIYGDQTRLSPGAKVDDFSVLKADDKRLGRELKSAAYTGDGRYFGAVVGWRPPRGRPTVGPDGKSTYRYSRPNKPPSPPIYVEVFDARTGKSVTPRTEMGLGHIVPGPTALLVFDLHKPLLFESSKPELRELPVPDDVHISHNAAFSPDGVWLAGIGTRGRLLVWRGTELVASEATYESDVGVQTVAVHPGGALFVGLTDGTMMFIAPKTGRVMHEWSDRDENDFDRHEIGAAAISDDGKWLATAHGLLGKIVRIWSLDGRE